MALSIKTKEADQLARELSRLTGESMTEAVTVALRERLARRRAQVDGDMIERVTSFTQSIAHRYDRRPVTKAEWDALSGEDD
jgi:antitoxin VapB